MDAAMRLVVFDELAMQSEEVADIEGIEHAIIRCSKKQMFAVFPFDHYRFECGDYFHVA